MKMDETLYHVADKIKNFAVMCVPPHFLLFSLVFCVRSASSRVRAGCNVTCAINNSYLVDISDVPDFNTMYEVRRLRSQCE